MEIRTTKDFNQGCISCEHSYVEDIYNVLMCEKHGITCKRSFTGNDHTTCDDFTMDGEDREP